MPLGPVLGFVIPLRKTDPDLLNPLLFQNRRNFLKIGKIRLLPLFVPPVDNGIKPDGYPIVIRIGTGV